MMAAKEPPTPRSPFLSNFDIVSQMRGRLYHAQVHHPDRTDEATAIVYKERKWASRHYKIMRDTPSRFVARAIGYQDLKEDSQAVLVVEELSTSSSKFPENISIWKLNSKGTTAIGWTDNIKEKYKQVLSGLRDLHERGFFHGNLADGFLYGIDGNIRLYNFAADDSEFHGSLKGDFQAFSDLMKKAAFDRRAELPRGQNKILDEVDCFERLMYHWPNESSATEPNVEKHIQMLYQAPIFWSNTKKVVFLESMYRFMNWDPALARKALAKVSYGSAWWEKITDEDLKACFDFKDDSSDRNQWYNDRLGPLVLGRNYVQHTKYYDYYISVLEETFPDLFSAPFIGLASGNYLEKMITFSQVNRPTFSMPVFDLLCGDDALYDLRRL